MIARIQQDLFEKSNRVRKPKPALEFVTHVMVADTLLRFCRPDWRYSHFPAGEKRDKATAIRLKRMGVMRGWPDFVLLDPGGAFHALELKRKGEHLNDDQDAFCRFCRARDVPYEVAWSYSEAIAILNLWNVFKTWITA